MSDANATNAVPAAVTHNNVSSSGSSKQRPRPKKSKSQKSFKKIRKIFGGQSKKTKGKKNVKGRNGDVLLPENSEYRISEVDSPQEKISSNSSFEGSTAPSPVSTVDSDKKEEIGTSVSSCHDIEGSFRIVLLLLDPETRRFELFHLDFESSQISVAEVLAQSCGSITAESLQKVTYSGLMTSDGVHRTGSDVLSNFCIGNDVLVGIPSTCSAEKIVQLASPILVDKNIVTMITDSGADTTSWKKNLPTSDASSTPTKTSEQSAQQRELLGSKEQVMESSNNSSRRQPAREPDAGGNKHMIIIAVEILLGLFLLYQYSSGSGHVVAPAAGLESCTAPSSPLGYSDQNSEQLFSCVRTCVGNVVVPDES